MVLSDKGIRKALAAGTIKVSPLLSQRQFQPASLELHLAGDEAIFLEPGEFRLASVVEAIEISGKFVAQVNGKSSLGRLGLLVHATAGFVDPGFRGQLTLELKNLHHRNGIVLVPGMPICQLVFFSLDGIPARLYGHPALSSHYQDQTGTTESWMGSPGTDYYTTVDPV